jgi:putative ABC transport system permease protein
MAAATSVGTLFRIARRDALHHRTHSLLTVAMIAMPVAGLTAGGTLLASTGRRRDGGLLLLFSTLEAMALAAAVLLAGAAFAIAARRQLRALGLVAAAGAGGHQLGAVVVLQAGTLGVLGALVGVPAGLLLARALLPIMADALNNVEVETGPLMIIPRDLVLAGVVGLLAAVAAALRPAISAARLPVTQALATRQPPARLPRRLTVVGVVAALAALGLATLQIRGVVLLPLGWNLALVVVMVAGFAACSPLLVVVLGRAAGRLPATLRLAVRDLARHPTRSGAAVAAVMAGLAVTITLAAVVGQSAAASRAYMPRELRDDQVVVNRPEAVEAVTELLPGARHAQFTIGGDAQGNKVKVYGGGIDQFPGIHYGLAIGDRQLLTVMGGEQAAAAFARGAVVAFGTGLVPPNGRFSLAVRDSAPWVIVPAVEVPAGYYTSIPSFVISRQTAERLGLPGVTAPPRYLVRARDPLSSVQRDQLQQLKPRLPVGTIWWAEPPSPQEPEVFMPGFRPVLLTLLLVAAIIALGAVGVACALALTEARGDLTTLAAVGAAPRTTRVLIAAQAWLLTELGALLAVAVALATTGVFTLATSVLRTLTTSTQQLTAPPMPLTMPWMLLAILTLAIPVLAAAGASLLGRSPTPSPPQRGGG